MTVKPVYVAFPASTRLDDLTREFVEAVDRRPGEDHQKLLEDIPHLFIDEVLAAFFQRPVEVTGMDGAAASVMNSVTGMVNKASRALVGKVFSDVDPREQIQLGEAFGAMMLEIEGKPWCGFRLAEGVSGDALAEFRAREHDQQRLIRVMQGIADGAVEAFFDRPIGCVSVGMVTRGLVKAGRTTVHKASYSAAKLLPELEHGMRGRVVEYFDGLTLELH